MDDPVQPLNEDGLLGGEPMQEKMAKVLAATHAPVAKDATVSSTLKAKERPQELKTLWESKGHNSEVFCVTMASDDALLAAGFANGQVKLFQAHTGTQAYALSTSGNNLPATCMRFRPVNDQSRTRNVLLTANADGRVQHWHVTSGKCLHTISEPDNQVFAVDYKLDGTKFATAGKDYTVRIYDEATKTKVADLCSGFGKKHSGTNTAPDSRELPADAPAGAAPPRAGHSNRVFTVKFHPEDPNVLLSAGWDNTIQIWDLRTEGAVRSIFGPHICGDSVDIHGTEVVSGSWRPTEQVQLWDYRSGELIANVGWPAAREPCLVYAALFDRTGGRIAAGGTGANEVCVFSRMTLQPLGVAHLDGGAYGLDFSHDGDVLAIATGDSTVRAVAVPSAAM